MKEALIQKELKGIGCPKMLLSFQDWLQLKLKSPEDLKTF